MNSLSGLRVRGSCDRLERAWREQGAPIADHLAPGATDLHLDEIEARYGAKLPAELRSWWAWHDGVRRLQPGLRLGPETQVGPGNWEFLSSAEAVEERDRRRAGSESASDADEDWQGGWRVEWLPILTMDAYALFVDCRQVTPSGTTPVRRYDHVPEDVFTPQTASLRQQVEVWTYLLEEHYCVWNHGNQSWDARFAKTPWPLRAML